MVERTYWLIGKKNESHLEVERVFSASGELCLGVNLAFWDNNCNGMGVALSTQDVEDLIEALTSVINTSPAGS